KQTQRERRSEILPGPRRGGVADETGNPTLEIGRGDILGDVRAQCRPQAAARFEGSSQTRLSAEAAVELMGFERRELAIQIGGEQEFVSVGGTHVGFPPRLASMSRRARASRDMTVPTGNPAISAIVL